MSEVPPLPPGFTLDEREPRKSDRRAKALPPPPAGFSLDKPTGEAVDGDTLRLENHGSLRLWGVDAPELKQQGWDRAGNAVPIGEDSRLSLDTIATADARVGPVQSVSYGRPVAPVTQDGQDVGLTMARSGEAEAAPEYLASNPQRRFDYMQAERLARQNRLGVRAATFRTWV